MNISQEAREAAQEAWNTRAEPPPAGDDGELVRYGVRWKSRTEPICEPMPDGYWTPWHIAAARIAALNAEVARLRAALAKIADGTMPRPLGEPWRMDMTSSKHDRCVHGAWMYEPCEGCIDAFIASVLGGANG